jgi:hypothetical protein
MESIGYSGIGLLVGINLIPNGTSQIMLSMTTRLAPSLQYIGLRYGQAEAVDGTLPLNC